MQVKFEQFAATSMLGSADAPPRNNGELLFQRPWEGRAFGMAIALSKKGHYEWEDFRQGLIASIAEWEATHCKDDPEWDYYQRWLLALERLAVESNLLDPAEVDQRTAELLAQETQSV
ncbi:MULTISPECIES: nitrile hydratase accessory protein [Trichocoleus]|uniref:Nitrile hydratase accessory protein n=1 Tax=Trichocoleus desertorum GB2-A4 TaxID=2933944 RepID=A0ABV0JH46_9CYAN|nr:nitrile hydratase accessory protein [Trichocoleus sp. FACHB-46]MBD1864488.1 nitrile hydratase accessory protein [Trichocoleus sp. FACHB-46]